MKIPQNIKPWIKILGLAIGIIADGIMLFACFTSQAPDPLGKFAFGALGIMIILLIPITYEERAFKLWFCLVLVAVFFDTSYLLATTREPLPGEIITIENDSELKRLTGLATTAQEALDTKLAEYDKAMKVDTRAQLDRQITETRQDATAKEQARKTRHDVIERGEVSGIKVTSKAIFEAIPEAMKGRWLHLFAYLLLSIIIQGIIIFSIDEPTSKKSFIARLLDRKKPASSPTIVSTKKPIKKPTKKPAVDHVSRWVSACWVGIENGRKDIISRSSFEEFYRTRGGFPAERYDAIKQAAQDASVIDPAGEILIKDKREAVNIIKMTMEGN